MSPGPRPDSTAPAPAGPPGSDTSPRSSPSRFAQLLEASSRSSPNKPTSPLKTSNKPQQSSPLKPSSPKDSLPQMASFVSLDDSIQESEFNFSSPRPVPKSKPKKVSKQDKVNKAAKIQRMAQAFESARVATNAPVRDLSTFTTKQLNEVNKVSRPRPELMKEMIITVPSALYTKLESHDVFEGAEVKRGSDNHIAWLRKVNSIYDKPRDIFIPADDHVIEESQQMMYMEAEDFINQLVSHKLDELLPNVIVVVEGYQSYLQKISSLENKNYRNKVLGKQKQSEIELTVKEVESLVIEFEYKKKVSVHPTKTFQETINWLITFTFSIAFIRYSKLHRNAEFSNLIPGKSGTDYLSTYLENIQKFKLMPKPRCERLYSYYDSLYKIYQKFVINDSLGNDNDDRRLVPETTEKAMRQLFLSDDPDQVIYDM